MLRIDPRVLVGGLAATLVIGFLVGFLLAGVL
jgi:tetrahydromethanopterin S-methyltransferase subunit F